MSLRTRLVCAASTWGLLAILATGACSSPPSEHDSCGPAHATFLLFVDAAEGPVPGDVRIHVRYGSGEEVFDAADPAASLKVVFCELERRIPTDGGTGSDAGASEGPIERVVCELWTDGAATVRVSAKGYPEVIRDLEAERDETCGLLLTESSITLEHEPER